MGRTQGLLFSIGMVGMFGTGAFCVPNAEKYPALLLLPAGFVLLVLASTVVWPILSFIHDAWNRRHGEAVFCRVVHARASGYTNHLQTWEVEAVLPDGTTTHLLVTRTLPFSPGEPIKLVVNPRDPRHAVLPKQPSYDF